MSFNPKPGINECTNEEYHAEKRHLSSSNLKLLLKDLPRFHKEKILGQRENKQVNAFDEGNYAHSLILEPHTIPDEYAFFTGFKKMGKVWDAFKEEHAGKIILSKPQKHRVEQWVEAYKKRKEAVKLVSGGKPELSVFHEIAGVPLKARADYINIDKGYIADVKTTSYSTDIESFKLVVQNLCYDLSAALYCRMFKEQFDKDFDFYFIVLGKKDNSCEVFKASKETLEKGEHMVMESLRVYKRCLETGDWSGARKALDGIDDTNYEILEV